MKVAIVKDKNTKYIKIKIKFFLLIIKVKILNILINRSTRKYPKRITTENIAALEFDAKRNTKLNKKIKIKNIFFDK